MYVSVILGKGLLQEDINKAIGNVEMYGKIYMLGHLDNPFSFISKMNYYVLPSLHEGQPMVLLEALVLGKKVMASNIKPNIGVLGDNKYGLIANGTTPNALYDGLKALIQQPDFEKFDYVKYNEEALEDFYGLLDYVEYNEEIFEEDFYKLLDYAEYDEVVGI